MNSHEFMRSYDARIMRNTRNSFKQRFLMHMDEVFLANFAR